MIIWNRYLAILEISLSRYQIDPSMTKGDCFFSWWRMYLIVKFIGSRCLFNLSSDVCWCWFSALSVGVEVIKSRSSCIAAFWSLSYFYMYQLLFICYIFVVLNETDLPSKTFESWSLSFSTNWPSLSPYPIWFFILFLGLPLWQSDTIFKKWLCNRYNRIA